MKKETVLHRLLIAREEMCAMMICNLMMTKNVNALKMMKKETVLHRLLIAREEMCVMMICNSMMTKNVNALKLMKKETVLHRIPIVSKEDFMHCLRDYFRFQQLYFLLAAYCGDFSLCSLYFLINFYNYLFYL